MVFTDQISVLIFSLVMLAVLVFVTMSKVIVGPVAKLRRVEKIVLVLSLIGVVMVVSMSASELLFHVLF
jgi:predicted tellurium resistance membrane protein TerC